MVEFVYRRVNEYGGEVLIKNVRLCWVRMIPVPNLDDNKRATRSVTMLIPKAEFDRKKFDEFVKQVVKLNKKVTNEKQRMAIYKKAVAIHADGSLLKDGDKLNAESEKVYDYIAGHYLLRAKQNLVIDDNGDYVVQRELDVRNKDKSPMPENFWHKEIYSGAICHVVVSFAVYALQINQGVTCYLNGVMKVKDAERFGAQDMFAEVTPAEYTEFDEQGKDSFSDDEGVPF